MKSTIFFKKKNISIEKLFPNLVFKKKVKFNNIKTLISSNANDLTFFDSIKYKLFAEKTKASVCITTLKLEKFLPKWF